MAALFEALLGTNRMSEGCSGISGIWPASIFETFTGTSLRSPPDSLARRIRALEGAAATVPEAALAIGPEGGWTDDEVELAVNAGFGEASLGRLILRTETAVVAALASLSYALNG